MAVETVTKFTDRPRTFFPFVVWLLMLLVIATVVLRVVDRQARRLLPLATLLRLSLVFPDQAPSRFSLALKSGTGRALERAVADTTAEQEFGTPQETAEAVVALHRRGRPARPADPRPLRTGARLLRPDRTATRPRRRERLEAALGRAAARRRQARRVARAS